MFCSGLRPDDPYDGLALAVPPPHVMQRHRARVLVHLGLLDHELDLAAVSGLQGVEGVLPAGLDVPQGDAPGMLHGGLDLVGERGLVVAVLDEGEAVGHLPAVARGVRLQHAGLAAGGADGGGQRHVVVVPALPVVHADGLRAHRLVEAGHVAVQVQLVQRVLERQLGRRVLEHAVADAPVAVDVGQRHAVLGVRVQLAQQRHRDEDAGAADRPDAALVDVPLVLGGRAHVVGLLGVVLGEHGEERLHLEEEGVVVNDAAPLGLRGEAVVDEADERHVAVDVAQLGLDDLDRDAGGLELRGDVCGGGLLEFFGVMGLDYDDEMGIGMRRPVLESPERIGKSLEGGGSAEDDVRRIGRRIVHVHVDCGSGRRLCEGLEELILESRGIGGGSVELDL